MAAREKYVTRWCPPSAVSTFRGLTAAITGPMTSEQIEAYALHPRIEEISRQLDSDDASADYFRRTSSPPPEYDRSGKQINTRSQRYRRCLEDERHALIKRAMNTIPNYRPPRGYKTQPIHQHSIKVYIPDKEFPHLNFIGQLLGPRGRSLA